MYKELYKSGKSAIGPAILWIVGMYVFFILWGICEILLEVNPYPLIKHIVLWALTGWFGWTLVSKFMYEYELAARKNEITVIKIMGKKSQTILSVKYENIEAIITEDEKNKLNDMSISKKLNIVRAFQNGKKSYLIYKFDGKICVMCAKMSRQMIVTIKQNMAQKKGTEI